MPETPDPAPNPAVVQIALQAFGMTRSRAVSVAVTLARKFEFHPIGTAERLAALEQNCRAVRRD